MKSTLSFLSSLLFLQALFALAYGRQRYLLAPEPQIVQSNVTEVPVPALEPAVEPPAFEVIVVAVPPGPPGQAAAQQVNSALNTASQPVSNGGGAGANGTANVAYAVVGAVSDVGRTAQDLAAVIGAAVGRKLQEADQN